MTIQNQIKDATKALGFIVWHQLRDVPVNKQQLDAALHAEGFDPAEWSYMARSRRQCFSDGVKRLTGRSYKTLNGNDQTRTMFALSLPDDGDTRHFSVHVAQGDKASKRNSLGQIGVIAFSKSTELISWNFTDLQRKTAGSQVEGDDQYISRRKAAIGQAGTSALLTVQDVDTFVSSVKDVCSHVDKFGDSIDARHMHFLIRQALYRPDMHAVRLRPSGGIYFLPNRANSKASDNPAQVFARLADVIMQVCPSDRIHVIPQYPDPGTINAVADSAAQTLTDKLSEINAELQDLTTISRMSQVSGKQDDIKRILQTADLYADLVGMKQTELQDSIKAARKRIGELVGAFEDSRADKPVSKRASMKAQLTAAEEENARLKALLSELQGNSVQDAPAPAPKAVSPAVSKFVPLGRTEAELDEASKQAQQEHADSCKAAAVPLTEGNIREACKEAKLCGSFSAGALTVEYQSGEYAWEVNGKAGSAKRVIEVVRAVRKADA